MSTARRALPIASLRLIPGVPSDRPGIFVPAEVRENLTRRTAGYAKQEVQSGTDRDVAAADRSGNRERKDHPASLQGSEITVQTYYRWRKEYGGLKLDQAKRLKELEKENAKLKRVVAELSLEKQVLKDIAEGNF